MRALVLSVAAALLVAGAAAAQRPAVGEPIASTAWRLVAAPAWGVARVDARHGGAQPTLVASPRIHAVRGLDGCGAFRAALSLVDAEISIDEVVSDEDAICDATAAERRRRYLDALQAAHLHILIADRLILLDESGAPLLAFAPDAVGDGRIRPPRGVWHVRLGLETLSFLSPTIGFDWEAGRAYGSTTCRTFIVDVEAVDGRIVFGDPRLDGPDCLGPPAQVERVFIEALEESRRFEEIGGVLLFTDVLNRITLALVSDDR